MNEADARRVVLVRAVESEPPGALWTDDDRRWASRAAGSAPPERYLAERARVALANADAAGASEQVRAILDRVAAGARWDTDFPVRLTCWRVLTADGDVRAADILASACADLQRLADKIPDPSLRHSFLDNVAAHRNLLAAQAASAA